MSAISARSVIPEHSAPPVVVCVDDEPQVLASLRLLLSRQYDVHTAGNGADGLELLKTLGSVAVVISDMRMPEMSGADFLGRVAQRDPNSVRILLTGATDIEAAAEAINTGNLFRFLLKPCAPGQLRAALAAGVELYRLRTAEQDLLERTLVGSIRALVEMLAIADPVAVGRTGRLKELVTGVAAVLGLNDLWHLEYAALVCQIGNISLSESTAKKLYAGQVLTMQERIQAEQALRLAPAVIKHIPRLDKVLAILEELASLRGIAGSTVSVETQILRTVLAFEAIERTHKNRSAAIQAFISKQSDFDASVSRALLQVLGAARAAQDSDVEVKIMDLRAGMVTAEELRAATGALLVPAGTEITSGLLAKLLNFPRQLLPSRIHIQNS